MPESNKPSTPDTQQPKSPGDRSAPSNNPNPGTRTPGSAPPSSSPGGAGDKR